MHIFYTPDIDNESKKHVLSEEESKHCIKVLRLREGDQVQLIDGKGSFYEASISIANARNCVVTIDKVLRDYNKRDFYLHIAISPTKNADRFEWFLEKATEIGIDEITPVLSNHSERKNLNHDRCEKVIIAAMKQSIIAKKPLLNELTKFNDLIKRLNSISGKYIAHCYEGEKNSFNNIYKKNENAVILIGPEGDFSKEEIEMAIKNNFQPVTLGRNRLRTETAGIVACEIINFINE